MRYNFLIKNHLHEISQRYLENIDSTFNKFYEISQRYFENIDLISMRYNFLIKNHLHEISQRYLKNINSTFIKYRSDIYAISFFIQKLSLL